MFLRFNRYLQLKMIAGLGRGPVCICPDFSIVTNNCRVTFAQNSRACRTTLASANTNIAV